METPHWHQKLWALPYFCWLPSLSSCKNLLWKDKDGIPRIEIIPYYTMRWLKWEWIWTQGSEREWEIYIWCTKYCDGNLQKAIDTWPWGQMRNGRWVRTNPLED